MKFLIVLSACMAATSGMGINFINLLSSRRSQAVTDQSRQSDQVDDSYEDSEYHYSWHHDGNKEYTGDQAAAYCKGLEGGWHAIAIETTGENNFVKNIIEASDITNIWTGAARAGYRWIWANGGPFREIGWPINGSFRPFHQPIPSNQDLSGRNCLAVMPNNGGFHWQDVPCKNTKPVICERTISWIIRF